MTDTAQRLKELRKELSELEWEAAVRGPKEVDLDRYRWIKREITRLSEYERLGYDEPNF